MSTKQKPGRFDCYEKLFDDEPYFVLRAKDPDAPATIEAWARTRAMRDGLSNPKLEEARQTAAAMRTWRSENLARIREHKSITRAFAAAHGPSAQGDGDPGPAPLRTHGLGAVERDTDDGA